MNRSGRHFAAWLGLTSREHSSSGHCHLGATSKRGDGYPRLLRIHGARAAIRAAQVRRQRKDQPLDRLQAWMLALQARQGHNKTAVTLANKLSRRI